MTGAYVTDSELVAPFVVYENGDVMMFDELSALTSYLEHYDVRNGIYTAWDSSGRALLLCVGEKNEVFAVAGEKSEATRDDLRVVLLRFLRIVRSEHPELDLSPSLSSSLEELIAAVHPLSRIR
jgi:hypothetical protein